MKIREDDVSGKSSLEAARLEQEDIFAHFPCNLQVSSSFFGAGCSRPHASLPPPHLYEVVLVVAQTSQEVRVTPFLSSLISLTRRAHGKLFFCRYVHGLRHVLHDNLLRGPRCSMAGGCVSLQQRLKQEQESARREKTREVMGLARSYAEKDPPDYSRSEERRMR